MPFVTSGIYTLMIRQIQLVDLIQKEKTIRCWGKVWYIICQNFLTFLGKEYDKLTKSTLLKTEEMWGNPGALCYF